MRHFLCGVFALACLLSSQFVLADAPQPTVPAEPAGMVQMFNGRDLEGWDGDPRLWSFKDGVLRGETTTENSTKGNTFLIWKAGEPGDFDLRLSVRIRNHNAGVQYRSKRLEASDKNNPWGVSGYQSEVDNTPGKAGYLYDEKGRKQLCFVGEKVEVGDDGKPKVVGKLGEKDAISATYKSADWNDYVIIARGNHLQHFVNGIQTVDVIDNDAKGRAMSGLIALQLHAGNPMLVEFKNVRIKQFPASP